jgi:hypothetical protein
MAAAALGESFGPDDKVLRLWTPGGGRRQMDKTRETEKVAIMKRNMGYVDRLIRAFVVAPVLIGITLTAFGVGSVLGVVALVFAGIMLATAAVGYCPTYVLLGISTRHAHTAGPTQMAARH